MACARLFLEVDKLIANDKQLSFKERKFLFEVTCCLAVYFGNDKESKSIARENIRYMVKQNNKKVV